MTIEVHYCPSCNYSMTYSVGIQGWYCQCCGYNRYGTGIMDEKSVSVSKPNETEEAFRKLLDEAFELWKKKHQSYGPYNISAFGERGVLVRVYDKLQRLVRLVWDDVPNPISETIEDTWLDTAVYCLIAVLVRRNKWPKLPNAQDVK